MSRRTRIEVVTEGVFTRMLQSDPALEGVGAVLFDERYLANPLVFCGTVGLAPRGRRPTQPRAGDLIVTEIRTRRPRCLSNTLRLSLRHRRR